MEAIDLPSQLDIYQALAWVRYRDASFAFTANWHALEAANFEDRIQVEGRKHLKAALLEGRLTAQGAKPSEEWTDIPSSVWLRLDVAPLDPGRHAPYEFIRLKWDEVIREFPASGIRNSNRGRPKGSGSFGHMDAPLIHEMAILIEAGKAASPNAAAKAVADRAVGTSFESKVTRLAKRFRALEQK